MATPAGTEETTGTSLTPPDPEPWGETVGGASLLSELKLHGATSTSPSGGRGRMAASKYDSTSWLPGIAARSRGDMTRAAFGVGIVITRGRMCSKPCTSSTARGAVVVPVTIR